MIRSAEAQGKPTFLQSMLMLVSLVIVLVTALWPSSTAPEPGLFRATRPGTAPAHVAEIAPRAATAPSSAPARVAPSQGLETGMPADCHPPRLTNGPRAEC